MRRATCCRLALGLLLPSVGLAADGDLGNALDLTATSALKDALVAGAPSAGPRVGGDDIATATPILSIPFLEAGNTCAFTDDYDESCPYSGSDSPDVVYRYTPEYDESLDILLCQSGYDTKVYVYEAAAGNLVACNDDACGSTTYQSELMYVPLYGGVDYYLVVDGYGGDCGDYLLDVRPSMPCFARPRGCDAVEGEPECANEYVDAFNGGCNSDPPVFSTVPCSSGGAVLTICGVGGGFDVGGHAYRDTDWYEVDAALNEAGFTWCVTGEIDMLMGTVAAAPCDGISGLDQAAIAEGCLPTCLSVPPGAHYLFLAVTGFGSSVGCHDYEMTIDGYGCGPVPVATESWAGIKGRFR